ncbi:unnamed protein product [Oikopleura dioica]|uniref:Sodium/calcium exchanger membrane region domain-containing protein n=1 Tax=Oikopleura dioica TaxID=34765 RepID=E4YDK3_OIKDI|nr:unnamed protein product [Oikopleura dioica]
MAESLSKKRKHVIEKKLEIKKGEFYELDDIIEVYQNEKKWCKELKFFKIIHDEEWNGQIVCSADAFFVPTLTKMATQLRLSDSVAGVTLVAFGGGAADIFASIVAFTNPDPEVAKLAIGSLLGAGMFVIMIVAGACMIAVDFTPAARPLLRDMIFYLWALYWLLQCLWNQKITLFDSIGFLVFYVFYVFMVFLGSKFGGKIGLVTKPDKIYPPVEEAKPARNTILSVRARAISSLSTVQKRNTVMSVAEVGLNPVSGQRARAFSNLSTVENKLEVETLAKSDDFEKNFSWYLKQACLPWDPVEFEEFGVAGKSFSVCFAPLYILCKWTIPIVAQKEEQSWNKPLMLIQSVLFPWSFYVLLKQYDSELDDFWTVKQSCHSSDFERRLFCFRFSDNDEIAAQQAAKMVHFQHNSGLPWLHRLDLRNRYRACRRSHLSRVLLEHQQCRDGTFAAFVAGRARTAIAACFGAPLLNLLVGVGFGCTITILTTESKDDIPLDFGPTEICLVAGGTAILLALLLILPMTNYQTNKALGIFNMCVYVVFISLCLYFGFQL